MTPVSSGFAHTANMLISLLSNIKHMWQTMRVDLVDAVALRKNEQTPKTLLLIHLDAIGDYILFRNFIRELLKSRKYHGYSITLCGNMQYRELAEWLEMESVSDFIWIDRNQFRFNVFYRFKMVRNIRERGFAVSVNPASSRIYYWGDSVIRASGSSEKIGSAGDTINIKPWQKRKSDLFYTRLVPATSACLFEFLRNKAFFAGLLDEPLSVTCPYIEKEKIFDSIFPGEPYAVLFPGAGVPFRRWNSEKFARVADHLNKRFGFTVVIAGSASDKCLAKHISSSIVESKVVDLTGRSTLPELVGIIAHADILISNETSAVHIAAAVGTRVICLSNGNHLGRFSPYPLEIYANAHYIYPHEIKERFNDFDALCAEFTIKSYHDINAIEAEEVIVIVDNILSEANLPVKMNAVNIPLITVITVVRNGVDLIVQTIESVLDSKYGNLEFIIIDGGSTDGTVDIIKSYADRLTSWTSEPDKGIYDAMNKGWGAAKGNSYILFLGAGDRLISLPKDIGSFGRNDVIYGDVELETRIFRGTAGFELCCNNSLHHQALLVPKALHPEPPFDLTYKVYADFDFNQRLLKRGVNFVHSAELRSYALPGGLSSRKAHGETVAIVAKNYGVMWSLLSLCFLTIRKVLRMIGGQPAGRSGHEKSSP